MVLPQGVTSTALRVHVCLGLSAEDREKCSELLSRWELTPTFFADSHALANGLPECVFLLIGRPPRIHYGAATRLALLQVAGAGVDPLFPVVGLRDEVAIASCRGVHADAVRDHVLASILAFARDLPRALRQQASAEWRIFGCQPVTGKHLVLLGYGAVGSRVAAVAKALGLRVSAVCRTPRDAPELERLFSTRDLSEAVASADYFVIAAPLTSETRGLVDADVLAALPARAIVVNVGRGGILDQRALEDTLRAGHLAGAALDVFEDEPLPATSTLWSCPRLLITPHIAGYELEYLTKVVERFAQNVHRMQHGEAPLGLVSRTTEY